MFGVSARHDTIYSCILFFPMHAKNGLVPPQPRANVVQPSPPWLQVAVRALRMPLHLSRVISP